MKVRVAIVGAFGLLVVGYLTWHVGFGPVFLRRSRDVAIGIPVLLLWQALESRRALAAARPD